MEEPTLKDRLKVSIVFYDVDTQSDFMYEGGALYVPDAEQIIPNVSKLTDYARRLGYMRMGSVDRHFKDDAELKANGGPFPEHCMGRGIGQTKIPATYPEFIDFVENKDTGLTLEDIVLENNIFKSPKEAIYFEKQHYDVFTNPNAGKVLKNVGYAVVYGVATDYCVKAAVLGMRQRGVDVFVVKDAIKGVTKKGSKEAIKEMKHAGAHFVTTKEVLAGKVREYVRACEGIIQ